MNPRRTPKDWEKYFATMDSDLKEIEAELPSMAWESHHHGPPMMSQHTGRGKKWTVQLVVLGEQRMAAATSGVVMIKLTDPLVKIAEEWAYNFQRRPEWA